jgi:hypothetical protein
MFGADRGVASIKVNRCVLVQATYGFVLALA